MFFRVKFVVGVLKIETSPPEILSLSIKIKWEKLRLKATIDAK